MKNIIFIITLLTIMGCKGEKKIIKEKNPVNYAIVSGTIINKGNDSIISLLCLDIDRSVRHQIKIEKDNTFRDTIRNASRYANNLYLLYLNNIRFQLVLNPGDNIVINANSQTFPKEVLITGIGGGVNTYLFKKSSYLNKRFPALRELYAQSEKRFTEFCQNHKNELKALLNNTTGIPDNFKAKENRAIDYWYLGSKGSYIGQNTSNILSNSFLENYKKEFKNLDYNNDVDILYSSSYTNLVRDYYQTHIDSLIQKENLDENIARLKIYGSIKNPIIKNKLIKIIASRVLAKITNFEEYYKTYLEAGTTDKNYDKEMLDIYNQVKKTAKGSPSPKFINYKNYAGGTVSLDDLKGKYIFIDVWATWCPPCIKEIPYLQKIEKQYHDKNIEFVSISSDKPNKYDKWKAMVSNKQMTGIQLIANDTEFMDSYLIKTIPRFILIDPSGNIISASTPKPSDPKLIELFNSLNI